MEQSAPWEANSHSASQETPASYWTRVLQPATDSHPGTNPVHTFPTYFPKIHSNIILHLRWAFRVVSSLLQNIAYVSDLFPHIFVNFNSIV
jgi:hypothetical protein